MKVTIANDRLIEVGDTVTLIGQRWYTNEHTFNVGDVMTIVEDDENSEMYMNISDGVITVEISGVKHNSNDFK